MIGVFIQCMTGHMVRVIILNKFHILSVLWSLNPTENYMIGSKNMFLNTVKPNIQIQQNKIFGADKEKHIINGTTMNYAQLDAFNRHIARMEDEAIQAKRMSIIELNINK